MSVGRHGQGDGGIVFYALVVTITRVTAVSRERFASLDEEIACAILACHRYSAYKDLAKEMSALLLAFCWAHVRRDFIEAARRYRPVLLETFVDTERFAGTCYKAIPLPTSQWDRNRPGLDTVSRIC
jgi:transposase